MADTSVVGVRHGVQRRLFQSARGAVIQGSSLAQDRQGRQQYHKTAIKPHFCVKFFLVCSIVITVNILPWAVAFAPPPPPGSLPTAQANGPTALTDNPGKDPGKNWS